MIDRLKAIAPVNTPGRATRARPPAPDIYPLAALVGQREMVQALMILAVDPSLGGLMLVGEKGTAKSTAARGLAELLPAFPTVAGCPYQCQFEKQARYCPDCRARLRGGERLRPVLTPSPFRDVPLGVTEDRLLGGLDWSATLKNARPVLKPGLLGEANGGLIYIDEVNLLEVSLAHLMLDAVSAGQVRLEREGLSASCPARVALLATMNPEEGSLGPQLADRFALQVTLTGEADPAQRAEVVRRRLAFEADPAAFRDRYSARTEALAHSILNARAFLIQVEFSEAARELIARLAVVDRLAGHRGDLALARAARARAALLGLALVSPREVLDIAPLVLPSRRRPAPPARPGRIRVERVEKADDQRPELFEPVYVADLPETPPEYKGGNEEGDREDPLTRIFKTGDLYQAVTPQARREVGPRGRGGRRNSRETTKAAGRSFRTTARRLGRPLSLSATLRAAAPHQRARRAEARGGAGGEQPLILNPADFREKVYRQKTGRLVVFVVDSSGSIGTLYRMEEAKAAVMSLLSEAYRKRDRVALIAFYGFKAEMLLPPTNSPDLAARRLAELPSGGKTPLSAALAMTQRLLRMEEARDPALTPHIIVMTDGRPNIPLDQNANPWRESLTMAGLMAEDPRRRFLLIDTDRGAYNDFKLTRDLAEQLRAPRINLEELREGRLEAWLAAQP